MSSRLCSQDIINRVSLSVGDIGASNIALNTIPMDSVHVTINWFCRYYRVFLASSHITTCNERSLLDPTSRPYEWCNNFELIVGPMIRAIYENKL